MLKKNKNSGFTLIELAMVLFVLGLLLAGFLAPLGEKIEQEERTKTIRQLEGIQELLYGFAVKEGRLPCPDCRNDAEGNCDANDSDDGLEDTEVSGGFNVCETEVGNLPWNTLGVNEFDVWGNHLTYRVTDVFADNQDGTQEACEGTTTLNVSFSLCSNGTIDVWNMEDNADADFQIIAQNVPAIVVSHGNNWIDAPSDQEAENLEDGSAGNNDEVFVDRNYSQDDVLGFDDLLIWISPHILINRMVISGKLP